MNQLVALDTPSQYKSSHISLQPARIRINNAYSERDKWNGVHKAADIAVDLYRIYGEKTLPSFGGRVGINRPIALKSWAPGQAIPFDNYHKFAKISSDAYDIRSNLTSEFSTEKLYRIQRKPDSIDYGIVKIDDTERIVVISFRGTVDLDDILHDIQIQKEIRNIEGTKHFGVHKGFMALTLKIYPVLQKILNEHFASTQRARRSILDYKVIFCGHSLGGAISQIAALMLYNDPNYVFRERGGAFNSLNQFTVISFSSPKVFCSQMRGYPLGIFTQFLFEGDNNLIRIHNRIDPIPKLPLGDSFMQVGKPIEIDYSTRIFKHFKNRYSTLFNPVFYHSIEALLYYLETVKSE